MLKLKWVLIISLVMIFKTSTSAFGGLYPVIGGDNFGTGLLTVTYGVDSATGTITADIIQEYLGSSPNFLWLIPVSGDTNPQIEYDFDPLVTPNAPIIFDLPPNYCANLRQVGYSEDPGSDGFGTGYPQPEYTHILQSNEILNWLSTSQYNIPPITLDAIKSYIQQGVTFVAIEMKQDENASYGSVFARLKYHSEAV